MRILGCVLAQMLQEIEYHKNATGQKGPPRLNIASTEAWVWLSFLFFNFLNKMNRRLMLWVNVIEGAWSVDFEIVIFELFDFGKVSFLAHMMNKWVSWVDVDKLALVFRTESK